MCDSDGDCQTDFLLKWQRAARQGPVNGTRAKEWTRLITNQLWSELLLAVRGTLPLLAPTFGGKTRNMWWKQTGAGTTRADNKSLKASLCPSCWAGCGPQQKLPWQDDVPGSQAADYLMQDLFIDVLPGNVSWGLFWGFLFSLHVDQLCMKQVFFLLFAFVILKF